MSSDKVTLENLEKLKLEAFKGGLIDNSKIQEITLLLKQIPVEEKPIYYAFAGDFLSLCFANSLNVGLKIQEFEEENEQVIKSDISEIAQAEQIEISKEILNFEDLLKKLLESLVDYFETYKGYFITKLQNSPGTFKVVFLYDDNFFYEPLKKKIDTHIENVIFKKISEFELDLNENDDNYLCVFLLMSKMNDRDGSGAILDSIKNIIESFQTFDSFSFVRKNDDSFIIENSNEKRKFLKEIKYIISTYLSNSKLPFEEQKIIKKLCHSFETPLVFYKTLKEGFSGAKVLELRPKKSFEFNKESRFIIKYGILDDSEKLNDEYSNFNKFIAGYKGFKDYKAQYETTLTHEGILYNYAISETSLKSFPFSEIIQDVSNHFHSQKNNIIDELFNCELMTHWGSSDFKSLNTEKISQIYGEYVNPEKIFEKIKIILDCNNSELEVNSLFVNFWKIWDYSIIHNQKVCHGDLHTDNFFKDDGNIYLIDFGYTNCRHALIDYTSLECSIKFKHFPFYVPMDEYSLIESELFSDKTFNLSYNFSSTHRTELLDSLSVINRIRKCANADLTNPNDFNEYFISLFIMTFRQILYGDLNQLYAYTSAYMLSEKLVHELAL